MMRSGLFDYLCVFLAATRDFVRVKYVNVIFGSVVSSVFVEHARISKIFLLALTLIYYTTHTISV